MSHSGEGPTMASGQADLSLPVSAPDGSQGSLRFWVPASAGMTTGIEAFLAPQNVLAATGADADIYVWIALGQGVSESEG